MATINVLIAEDMRVVRDALTTLISMEDDLRVVATVDTADQVVRTLLHTPADVALIDIHLGDTDGLTAAADVAARAPGTGVVVLSAFATPENVRRAMAASVRGFVSKHGAAVELIDAIRRVAARQWALPPHLVAQALRQRENPLRDREAGVLRTVAGGASLADAARVLRLSEGTVRNYVSRSIGKLGARNRIDAIRIAAEHGWL